MLFDRLVIYNDREATHAAMNMAIDEALLEQSAVPVLRFYGWRRPSVSFGYFGKLAEVAAEAEMREIVRRWTGGGIVRHGEDLTYSLVTPAIEPAFAHGPPRIYAELHAAICDALRAEGKQAELAVNGAPKISDACFANPVRNDVMLRGRKIAGAAQRRTRGGFLHQGSIQLTDLSAEFRERFACLLSVQVETRDIPRPTIARALQLATEKYATCAWLHRW